MDEHESPNGFCKLFNFDSTCEIETIKMFSRVLNLNEKCECGGSLAEGVDLKSGLTE